MAARGRLKLGEPIFHHTSGSERLTVRSAVRVISKTESVPCLLLERRGSDHTIVRIEVTASEAGSVAAAFSEWAHKQKAAGSKPSEAPHAEMPPRKKRAIRTRMAASGNHRS